MYCDGINPVRVLKSDFDLFWKFYPAAMTRILCVKITGKKLRCKIYGGGKIVHNQDKGNNILKQLMNSGKPFMFGRHGSNELLIALNGLMLEKGIIDRIDCKKWNVSCLHSGFFPNEEQNYVKFNKLIINSSAQCDLYGTFRMVGEDYYIKHFMPQNVQLTHLNMMDFWRYEEPFTYLLRGKRVLVVHYLANQIEKQYAIHREKLFKNPKVLPEFKLITIPAVQTVAGERDPRFSTWFDALEYMVQEVKKRKDEFDIALLGCGAYGMPLAAEIKGMGKQAIYMGGVLQMLFGIYGSRWDAEPKAKVLKNEYWVKPDPNCKPKNEKIVEDGCYW